LIDLLINRARSFIFSTAPGPAAAAAAAAAIQIIQSADGDRRRKALKQRVAQLQGAIGPFKSQMAGAILPMMIGGENQAVETAAALQAQGIFVPAIRYPTVARGKARLRITATATHTEADIAQFIQTLGHLKLPSASPISR
jgi:7-keto-8-aminopelargonate synthetase-like enzyme